MGSIEHLGSPATKENEWITERSKNYCEKVDRHEKNQKRLRLSFGDPDKRLKGELNNKMSMGT